MKFLKTRLTDEIAAYKNQTNLFDLIVTWGVRLLMVYGIIRVEQERFRTLMILNTLATFLIMVFHLFSPKNTFFHKLSYKVETYLAITVFFGSYMGHYIYIYSIYGKYDLFLHLLSGAVVVIVGYYIAITLMEINSKKHIQFISLFSFFFSGMFICAWEIGEFFGDYYSGSANQGYSWVPRDNFFLFKLFGRGANITAQFPLYDTITDMLSALVTAIIATVILYLFLYNRFKKSQEKEITQTQEVVENVLQK